MSAKCCHRCLISSINDARFILHMNMRPKCKITNPNYNVEYEEKLIKLCNQQDFDLESDSDKHIIELEIDDKIFYQCNLCGNKFAKKYNCRRHLMEVCLCYKYKINDQLSMFINQAKNPNMNEYNLSKSHIAKPHPVLKNKITLKSTRNETSPSQNIYDDVEFLKKKIQNIEQNAIKPITINNMNFVCLRDNEDSFDLLTKKLGNFDQALEFVKGCALSQMTGDVRLIEKLYFDEDNTVAFYLDKKRKMLEMIDDNDKKYQCENIVLGRKLANNLQKGYLRGVNYLINKNLEEKRCPYKFLAEYDIQAWNAHIYQLSDAKYQKKMLAYVDIPIKPK